MPEPVEESPKMVAPGAAGREVRVHGIGDKHALSSFGAGIRLDSTGTESEREPEVYAAPSPPEHKVRFLNWSRSARSIHGSLIWYAALPYTLLNTAGEMQSTNGVVARIQRWTVLVWGLVLTGCTVLWAVTFVERAFRYVPEASSMSQLLFELLVAACPLVAVLVLLGRGKWFRGTWSQTPESDYQFGRALTASHILVVLAVAAIVEVFRPARATQATAPFDCAYVSTEKNYCLVYANDWHTLVVLLTLIAAGLILVIFVGLSFFFQERTWTGTDSNPLLGCGILVLGATAILHLTWTAFSFALSRVLQYIDKTTGWEWGRRSAGFDSQDSFLLVAVNVPGYQIHGAELALLIVPIPLVALATAAIVYRGWYRIRRSLPLTRNKRESQALKSRNLKRRALLIHKLICEIRGTTMSGVVLVIVLASSGLAILALSQLRPPSSPREPATILAVATVLQHLVVIAGVSLAVFKSVRAPLAVVGDIVGFWPPKWHPFAGLSYRPALLAGVRRQCEEAPEPVALVGHSQGSVVAFWYASTRKPDSPNKVSLVTCGSPLVSLYARFFPLHFHEDRFDQARAGTAAWSNFWRRTDPIATPVGLGDEQPLNDPSAHGARDAKPVLRGHGDYWTEPAQLERVAQQLTQMAAPSAASPPTSKPGGHD